MRTQEPDIHHLLQSSQGLPKEGSRMLFITEKRGTERVGSFPNVTQWVLVELDVWNWAKGVGGRSEPDIITAGSRDLILLGSLCERQACSLCLSCGPLPGPRFCLADRVRCRNPSSESAGGEVRLREGQGLAPGHRAHQGQGGRRPLTSRCPWPSPAQSSRMRRGPDRG